MSLYNIGPKALEAEDAFDRQIEQDAKDGTLDRIAAALDAEIDPTTSGEEAK
jgi:hypothetical protein